MRSGGGYADEVAVGVVGGDLCRIDDPAPADADDKPDLGRCRLGLLDRIEVVGAACSKYSGIIRPGKERLDSLSGDIFGLIPGYDEHRVTEIKVFADGRELLDDAVSDDDVPRELHPLGLVKNLGSE